MKTFLEKWEENLHEDYYEKEKPVEDTKIYDELVDWVSVLEERFKGLLNSILEIGAGDGYIVKKLKEKNKTVVGTTICKEDEKAYKLKYADMHNLKCSDKELDVVIARHVLEHALSPRLVIREVWRVLKDEGWFIIEVPINHKGIEWGNRSHFYCFMPNQWDNLLHRNGFVTYTTEFSGDSYRMIMQKSKMLEV